MNDFLTFEHETKLPDGNWLLAIYRYDSKSGLTANKIFDRASLEDVTEKYKNHPNVLGIMHLIIGEVEHFKKAE
jgi:predicted neuraminidase